MKLKYWLHYILSCLCFSITTARNGSITSTRVTPLEASQVSNLSMSWNSSDSRPQGSIQVAQSSPITKTRLSIPSVAPSARYVNHTTRSLQDIARNATKASQNFNISTVAVFSLMSNALECYTSSGLWSMASVSFCSAHTATFSTLYSGPSAWDIFITNNSDATSTYTLCDGLPRVSGNQLLSSTSITPFVSYYISPTETYTVPPPSCSIDSLDCDLISSLRQAKSISVPYGACGPSGPGCHVNGNNLRLLYWPAATVVGSLCNADCPNPWGVSNGSQAKPLGVPICSASRSVIMPSASGLVTAVFDGHTFTSPTVYLSFDYLSTELDLPLTANTSLSAPGVILTNVFVPIASASVSTIYWNDTDFYTASMDWSNFNAPVPYLAYNQGRVGWNGEISTSATIFPDDFAPYISLPSTIVNLVPEWSRCSLNDVGVWDPPHALQPAADPAQPVDTFTSTKFPVSTNSPGPAPGPSVGSFGPTSTDIPRPTPHPKSTANSPGIDPPIVPPANPAPVKSTAGSSPEIPDQSTGLVPPLGLGSSSLFGNGNGAALAPASNNGGSQVSETAINDDPGNEGAPSTPLASGADPGMSFGPSLGANSGTTGRSPAEIIASALGWSPDSGGSGSRPDSSGSGGDTLATEVPGQIGPSDGSQGLDPSNGEFGSGSNFEDDPASELAPQPLSSGSDARSGSRPEEVRFTLADGHSFTAVMVSHRPDLMNVDGQTLRIGGNAKAIDGSTFSAAPGGIVFVSGSQTSTIPLLPQATPAAPVIRGLATFTGIDSSILTASADSQNHNFVVGGRTISSGGPAFTVDGNIMSAGSDGLVVMHRTQTQVINFPSLPPEEAIFTALDGEMVTAYHAIGNNGAVVIDGHTLSVGGLAATLDGDTVSAIADGFVVIHGTQTQTLHFPSLTPGETIFTAPDGRIMTAYNDAANSGAVVVDGKPISVGGPAVTVNGETLSDGPSGLVVGDTIGKSTVAIQMSKPIFTAPDGRVMTASIGTANSAIVVIDGHILSVGGPAVTIDGETLSDGPSGLVVEDTMGRSTVALQTEKTPAATVPTATGSQTSNVDTMSTPLAANGAGGSLAWNITYIIVVVAVAAAISCR